MISKDDVKHVQRKSATLKAVVIGDAMLDKYIYGVVDRISPEAPVPILRHHQTEYKAGGAANVALNLSGWGCKTSIISTVGNDRHGKTLKDILEKKDITTHFYQLNTRPTTLKTRVVATSHHLLRIDEEFTDELEGDEEVAVNEYISQQLLKELPDLIIIEDYNKGLLTKKIISTIIQFSRNHNVFIAVDPKEKNFMEYREVDLFKPNLREASLASNKNLGIKDLPGLTLDWIEKLKIRQIAVTLGSEGIFLQDGKTNIHLLPDRSIDVIDVCGAGDAVICGLTLAIMSGLEIEKTGALANLTGAYVCSHSGVVTIEPEELTNWV